MTAVNDLGQPIGKDLAGWQHPAPIRHQALDGRYVRLRPLTPEDDTAIYNALEGAPNELFTYMSFGPFHSVDEVSELTAFMVGQLDWMPYVIEVDGDIQGFESYLRINEADGVIEIGSIMFSPILQRTTAATESAYLLLDQAFDAGYRRVEWKCDSLNEPSRKAGERLGFRYEGTFLNATHYKGRNRDTAWFAITDEEWPSRRLELESWLDPSNFDAHGRQLRSLSEIRSSPTRP